MVFILTFYLNNDLLSTGLASHFYVPENHRAELNQVYGKSAAVCLGTLIHVLA